MAPLTPQDPIHLCVTHSFLVSRVFQAAARRLAIPESAVRTIALRGVPFQGIGWNAAQLTLDLENAYRSFNRAGYRKAVATLHDTIHELTGGRKFEAYLPHLNKILHQEISNHPLCAGYSFLEEGYTAMSWSTRVNARHSAAKLVKVRLRNLWIRPRYQFCRKMFDHKAANYRAAFAISDLAFKNMPGRIDVSPDLPPLPPGEPPGKTYVVLDTSFLHQGLVWENYENALVAAVRETPDKPLWLKFHPGDRDATKRFDSIVRRLDGVGFPEIRMLDRDFPLEDRLTASDLLVFATTSLGYYFVLTGGRTRCFAREIAGMSIPQWVHDRKLPVDFAKVVGLPPDL